jgi:hypothetical protein
MSGQAFTKNHRDHSNNNGFQFEFFCDKCGSGQRSPFKVNTLGLAASVLKAAGAIFGGGYRVGHGADHLNDAFRGPAWDSAFKEAILESKPLFRQCTLCGDWVCPAVCWNEARGLCEKCAPNLAEHAPAIQAQVGVEPSLDPSAQRRPTSRSGPEHRRSRHRQTVHSMSGDARRWREVLRAVRNSGTCRSGRRCQPAILSWLWGKGAFARSVLLGVRWSTSVVLDA